jgi:hypothetical protein
MRATEFTEGEYTINLRSPKDNGWAIMKHNFRLSRKGELDYEPMPSSRTETWIKNHTFSLEEAKKKVKELIKKEKVITK